MATIYKTREDLIYRAATELGKLVSGQTIEAEDNDTIDGVVDPVCQQLSADYIVDIDPAQVDPQYFIPLARLVANEAAPSFGIAKSADVQAVEERTLRRLASGRPTYQPLISDYF